MPGPAHQGDESHACGLRWACQKDHLTSASASALVFWSSLTSRACWALVRSREAEAWGHGAGLQEPFLSWAQGPDLCGGGAALDLLPWAWHQPAPKGGD